LDAFRVVIGGTADVKQAEVRSYNQPRFFDNSSAFFADNRIIPEWQLVSLVLLVFFGVISWIESGI